MLGSLNLTLVAAATSAAVAFGAAWAWQGARCTATTQALERQYAQAAWAAEAKAREQESAFNRRIQDAERAAAQREAGLRSEHARTERVVVRVRDAATSRVQVARDSPAAACPDTASVLAVALGECTQALAEMARDADALRVEAQKLIDAWPR